MMMLSSRSLMVISMLLVIAGISAYVFESGRYASTLGSQQVADWWQLAKVQQQDGDKEHQRTRNIFHTGTVKRSKKTIAKASKPKKKTITKAPKPAVVDMASRLRCLAVAKRGQQWTAYVSLDGKEQLVKPGDVINEQVRILEISEAGVRVEDMKANKQSVVPVLGA